MKPNDERYEVRWLHTYGIVGAYARLSSAKRIVEKDRKRKFLDQANGGYGDAQWVNCWKRYNIQLIVVDRSTGETVYQPGIPQV